MPSVHPASARLACHLVKECFGELCETVLKCMLLRGPVTLSELRQYLSNITFFQSHKGIKDSDVKNATPPTPADIRRALLVLLQHSCVNARLPAAEGKNETDQPLYRVDLKSTIFRLRHPECAWHIRELYHCAVKEAIIDSLLDNGRLSLQQIKDAVVLESASAGQSTTAQEILQAIGQLVDSHYVERALPCNLPDVKTPIHPDAQPRRGRAAPKKNTPEEAKMVAERSRSNAVKRHREQRYDLSVEELHAEGRHEDIKPSVASLQPSSHKSTGGGKRKREAEDPLDTSRPPAEPTGLWQISQNEFTRQFRYAACARFLGQRHGQAAQAVVQGMLAASSPWTEPAALEKTSSPVNQANVVAATQRLPAGADMEETAIRKTLQELRSAMDGCVLTTPEGGFYINLERTVELMREAEVLSHLQARFGTGGLRIWNMLRMRGQLEESTIAEASLMPPKELRTILYTLLASGFLSLQDIPKGSERAASRMFWTWRAHVPSATRLLAEHLTVGMLSIRKRLEHETSQLEDVTQAFMEGRHLVVSQIDALQRLRDIQTVCEGRLLRLQPLLSLFCEY